MVKLIVTPKQYSPQDAIDLIQCTPLQANFNQATGTAYSFFSEKEELLACGGVREFGVGEAWLIASPDVKGKMKKTLLQTTASVIDKIIRDGRMWRLWADSEHNGNFLHHVGFKKAEAFKWEAGQ